MYVIIKKKKKKKDIIRFITLWCMFINAFICSISSFFTFISIRRKKYIPIIILVYIIYGGIVGIINGFLVGKRIKEYLKVII